MEDSMLEFALILKDEYKNITQAKHFQRKDNRPWKLFFYEEHKTRTEARTREKFLKAGSGKEFIKNKWSGSSAE